jgi:hypothetical protein
MPEARIKIKKTTDPFSSPLFPLRLFARSTALFPPAFVMDVGVIEDRGWAVVEFNPPWCSEVLGADPQKVLAVLERACQDERQLAAADRRCEGQGDPPFFRG